MLRENICYHVFKLNTKEDRPLDLGITATHNSNSPPTTQSLQFAHTKSKHYIPDHKRNIEVNAKNIKIAMENFREFHQELSDKSFESSHLVKMGALAKLCRQHFLLTGAPGNGKSFITDALLRVMNEETNQLSFFSMQVNAETMADDLLGPVDYQRSMREGRMVRVVESGALAFNFGHIEEVFDAPFSLLRALLGLLYERKFRQGDRIFEGATETIGMTSNRYISDLQSTNEFFNPYQAFIDRILFVSYVPEYFGEMSHYEKMMKNAHKLRRKQKLKPFQAQLTCGDLDVLQALTEQVTIPKDVYLATVELVEKLNHQLNQLAQISEHEGTPFQRTKEYSKRSFVSLVSAIQSIVVYNKIFKNQERSLVATINDLEDLWYALILIGPESETIEQLLANNLYSNERELRQLLTVQREQQAFREAFKQTKENYKEHRSQEESQILDSKNQKLLQRLTIKPKLLPALYIFNQLQETQSHLFTDIGEEKVDELFVQVKKILIRCTEDLEGAIDFTESDLDTRLKVLEQTRTLCELYEGQINRGTVNTAMHQYIDKTYNLIQHSFKFEVDDPFRSEKTSTFFELPRLLSEYCLKFEKLESFETYFSFPPNQTSEKLFKFLEDKIANSGILALKSLKFTGVEQGLKQVKQFLVIWQKMQKLAFINLKMPETVAQTLDIHFSYELSNILSHPQRSENVSKDHLDSILNLLLRHQIVPNQILWSIRKKLNTLHKTQLRLKNPKKLSYDSIPKDRLYEKYIEFKKQCEIYINYIDTNQIKQLNQKYSKICEKSLEREGEKSYFTFVENFNPFIIESTFVSHQINFLKQWFTDVSDHLKKNKLYSHASIQEAIEDVQQSQFPDIIQDKEFFRLNEKLKRLKELVPQDENAKKQLKNIEQMTSFCANIEQAYLNSIKEVIQAQSKLTLKALA